jgi:hypothetical protein
MRDSRPPVLGNGWAKPVPPYITYPVENVGWGDGERPPFAPARLVERGQVQVAPASPPPPAPRVAPPPMVQDGPIPVEDWFNLLRG